ncbi:MAG: DNA-processing protein DprA [Anaerolineae bacterium]
MARAGLIQDDSLALITLSLVPGVGGVLLRRLLAHFSTPAGVLNASPPVLMRVRGVGRKIAGAISSASIERTTQLLERWHAQGIQLIPWDSPAYPANLRLLPDSPPLLFVRGALLPADETAVAVVGTRRPTAQGKTAAGIIAAELACRGVTVVSGMARGVDSLAHLGAVRAGGRTIAVLGVGLLRAGELPTAGLLSDILSHGAILSELPPDAGIMRQNLVARNRLISGISRAVIIVETGKEGGSMYAASFAGRQGRALWAVPGSAGCDALLGKGARPLDWRETDWDALADEIRAVELSKAAGPPTLQERLLEEPPAYRSQPPEL